MRHLARGCHHKICVAAARTNTFHYVRVPAAAAAGRTSARPAPVSADGSRRAAHRPAPVNDSPGAAPKANRAGPRRRREAIKAGRGALAGAGRCFQRLTCVPPPLPARTITTPSERTQTGPAAPSGAGGSTVSFDRATTISHSHKSPAVGRNGT